jgi:hypothetical protein
MTKPPHCRGGLADEPRLPPHDDHPWQRPAGLLKLCLQGTQARDKCAWIASAVGVVLPNERPAASFVSLILIHLCACPTIWSATVVTVEDVIDGDVDRDIPQPNLIAQSRRYLALDLAGDLMSWVSKADRNG